MSPPDQPPVPARAVLRALHAAFGEEVSFGIAPGSPPAWSTAAFELGLVVRADDAATVKVVPQADQLADHEAADWARQAVSGAQVLAIGTVHPVEACPGQVGRWPSDWARLFAVHGWRFVDLLRPALWDDHELPPGVKEGWLVFVAPGHLPGLAASPPQAILHPERLALTAHPSNSGLEVLRQEFQSGVRRLAHRRELEALRHRLDETIESLDTQQIRYEAMAARAAATERRVLLLLEASLGLRSPPAPRGQPPAPSRGWRRLLPASLNRGRINGTVSNGIDLASSGMVSLVAMTLFEIAEYVNAHPDSASDPLDHYLRIGEPLGYRPNRWFDPLYYRADNPDVRAAGVSPLLHFADHGAAEGRNPSEEFDLHWYLGTYPEVRASGLNPLLHYIAAGQALGYDTGPPGRPWGAGSAPS